MVSKWQVKNPLTIDERKKIKQAIDCGLTYLEMSLFVGRGKTTMIRECKRLGQFENYDPEKAQKNFEEKQMRKKRKTIH